MAQLSTNTIFYDQIITKIQDFINKYKNNRNASFTEIATEYNLLITEVNKYANDPIAKYEPIIKGEPPSSQRMNKFIQSISDDLNIVAKQLDYQTGTIVSVFNMFNAEIEKENRFTNRLKSKINILNAYSSSPGTDLYYFGDSFDNLDFIDVPNSQAQALNPISPPQTPYSGALPLIRKWNGFSSVSRFDYLAAKISTGD
jgi:superfamily I DNA/RNA helicase